MTTIINKLSIDQIRTDGGTQMRVELNEDVHFEYRDKWIDGVEFDPLDVFHDGSCYWLADGFHRFYGARLANMEKLPCRVHNGTRRDAILHAAGANAGHGLRRTNADKRRAVETLLNDEEWVQWSDRQIADAAAVSHVLVQEVRKQLEDSSSSPAAKSADKPRIGKDGKKRKPKRKPMVSPKPDAPIDLLGGLHVDVIDGADVVAVEHIAEDDLPSCESPEAQSATPAQRGKALRITNESLDCVRRLSIRNPYRSTALRSLARQIENWADSPAQPEPDHPIMPARWDEVSTIVDRLTDLTAPEAHIEILVRISEIRTQVEMLIELVSRVPQNT